LPRDYLCVEEEFMPSSGTYVDDGKVFSAVIGRAVYDMALRRVYVLPIKRSAMPKPGDVVVGQVTGARDDIAFVKILGLSLATQFKNSFTGLLHVSQVSEHRVQTVFDALRIGDLIKAKVLSAKPPFLLTTKEPRLGVILAYCSRCGAPLVRVGGKLVCSECGSVEERKVSLDYLLVKRGRR